MQRYDDKLENRVLAHTERLLSFIVERSQTENPFSFLFGFLIELFVRKDGG